MNPSDLVPMAEAIPAHWIWFKILLLLTFVLHILFMNVLLGGSLLSFWGNIRPAPETDPAPDLSKRLPVVTAMTINLGVAPLLFLQVIYGNYIYVSSVLGAVYWLSIIGLVMLAYYGLYLYAFKYENMGGRRSLLSGLVALCLLLVAFFFVNNMTLMVQPAKWTAYFKNPGGTVVNWGDPTLFPRYLHFVVASVAVAGLFTALAAHLKTKGRTEEGRARVRRGMRTFGWASVVQIFMGLWLLISLPKEIMLLFMGDSAYATILLLLGLAAAAAVLVAGFKEMVIPAVAAIVSTVAFMALMRDVVRDAYLRPFHDLSKLEVVSQVSPFILFLATFVVGLAVVGYMLKLFLTADKVG